MIAELLKAQDYREFLRAALADESYAAFARKAGFAARSYPRDVVQSKKRITPKSLPGFIAALGLTGDAKTYFSLLVARDEKDCRDAAATDTHIEARMQRIRKRLENKSATTIQKRNHSLYQSSNWPAIYASLGRSGEGATVADISARTGLAEDACRRMLKAMRQLEMIGFHADKGTYFADETHLVFDQLGGDAFFQQSFLQSVQKIKAVASAKFKRRDHLFLRSDFSIAKSKLDSLREELRQTIVRFVDAAEDPDGSGVVTLTVGMMPFASAEEARK